VTVAKKDSEIEENKNETPGSRDVEHSDVTAEELGADEVQEKMDEEQEKGYRGHKVDPTPNHAYSVEGVANNEPTPENDPEAARKVGSAKFAHLEEGETDARSEDGSDHG
jgi:hypothetical protein